MTATQSAPLTAPVRVERPGLGPASSHPREPIDTSLAGLRLERSLDECVGRDPAPIPVLEDRGGEHGLRHFDFWLSGLADHLRIVHAAAWAGPNLASGDHVLDFVCGSDRVPRHFVAPRPDLEACGVDADPGSCPPPPAAGVGLTMFPRSAP